MQNVYITNKICLRHIQINAAFNLFCFYYNSGDLLLTKRCQSQAGKLNQEKCQFPIVCKRLEQTLTFSEICSLDISVAEVSSVRNGKVGKRQKYSTFKGTFSLPCRDCMDFFFYHTLTLVCHQMAWLIIFFSTWMHKIMQFIMSGSILFLPPYTRGEKNHLV